MIKYFMGSSQWLRDPKELTDFDRWNSEIKISNPAQCIGTCKCFSMLRCPVQEEVLR